MYALIRGENSKEGEKVYLHDKMNMYADDLYDRLTNNGAYIYFSGLEEMMIGIESMFSELCSSKGVDYDEWKEKLERNGQWHVQVGYNFSVLATFYVYLCISLVFIILGLLELFFCVNYFLSS